MNHAEETSARKGAGPLNRIPILKPEPQNPELSIDRLASVWNSGIFSNHGPMVRSLEDRLSHFFGVPAERVVVVANATIALWGCLAISPASDWTVPSWTFAATAHAAKASGKRFCFADVNLQDWRLDLGESLEESAGRLLVLPFGTGFAGKIPRKGEIVVDAAASFGELEGSLGGMPEFCSVVVSLHVTKVLGAGEGGVAIFGSAARAEAFRRWINFGFGGSRSSLQPGTNGKLSEYMAAFLHTELDSWASQRALWLRARSHVDRHSIDRNFANHPNSERTISPYWIVQFQDPESKELAKNRLAQSGIEFRDWWGGGCHTMEAFESVPRGRLDKTEFLASVTLGLPFFKSITEEQISFIASEIDGSNH